MRKIIVIVLALAIIMTGCFAVPSTYLTDRESFIRDLVAAQSTDAHEYDATHHDKVYEKVDNAVISGAHVPNKASLSSREHVYKFDVSPYDVINAINAVRKEHGLSPVSTNQDLEASAHIRANEASYQFTHYRPDGTPCTTVHELADGEILSISEWGGTIDDIMNSWMTSTPHREAILMNRHMEAGAGVYYNYEQQTACWCVLFHLV